MRTISERCYNLSQSWHYKKVVAIGKLTFKIYIKRNAYDFQCKVQVSVYDTKSKSWNQIVSAPIMECECKKISYIHIVKEETDTLCDPTGYAANARFPQPDHKRIDAHKREQQTY